MNEQVESEQLGSINGPTGSIDAFQISRRRLLAAGGAATAGALAGLLGGMGNPALASLALASPSGRDEGKHPRKAVIVVPSPKAIDAINSAVRSALEDVQVESFEEGKALLQKFLRRVEDILNRADFVVIGLDFRGPQAEDVRAAMERLLATVEELIISPRQDHSRDVGARQVARLSECDKAFIRGVRDITLGALIGGAVGALAGFVSGVIEVALEC